MTHNATISIAAKWLDDMNNETLNAEQRAQAKKNYEQLIATAGFPNKPDGSPMGYRTAVKVGVVFADAKQKQRAKEVGRNPHVVTYEVSYGPSASYYAWEAAGRPVHGIRRQ